MGGEWFIRQENINCDNSIKLLFLQYVPIFPSRSQACCSRLFLQELQPKLPPANPTSKPSKPLKHQATNSPITWIRSPVGFNGLPVNIISYPPHPPHSHINRIWGAPSGILPYFGRKWSDWCGRANVVWMGDAQNGIVLIRCLFVRSPSHVAT